MALQLGNPNAATRVSGFWKKALDEWQRSRNRRLPDRGGHLPYKGQKKTLANGAVGGTPRGPYAVNLSSSQQPILKVPSALAARFEFLRRQVRRDRLRATQQRVLLGGALTWSGLEHAQAPRMKDTPSGYRGALRDRRHPGAGGPGVQYYEQEVAPFSTVRRLTAQRILSDPRQLGQSGEGPKIDYASGNDLNAAIRLGVATASGSAVGKIIPAEAPNSGSGPLALLLVGVVFFFVFWRR